MNLLLHMCCAPCAIYPLARLAAAGFSTTGLFYNPNIHPYQEYGKRLETVREHAVRTGLPLIVLDHYDLESFLAVTLGRGSGRCEQCYRMRLDAAAGEAGRRGFGLFSSTLLYSKYQNHDLIAGVAREMAAEHKVEFLYEDFRDGWKQGIEESKALGMYRQQYCGCIFSERERYAPGFRKKSANASAERKG
ncbi:MAG: epoxyqueuosine reductase QueH [Nitrospirota bacterium]|nr:epoxyqueuosine reductase QueH [Nitrospirota bacterium]